MPQLGLWDYCSSGGRRQRFQLWAVHNCFHCSLLHVSCDGSLIEKVTSKWLNGQWYCTSDRSVLSFNGTRLRGVDNHYLCHLCYLKVFLFIDFHQASSIIVFTSNSRTQLLPFFLATFGSLVFSTSIKTGTFPAIVISLDGSCFLQPVLETAFSMFFHGHREISVIFGHYHFYQWPWRFSCGSEYTLGRDPSVQSSIFDFLDRVECFTWHFPAFTAVLTCQL